MKKLKHLMILSALACILIGCSGFNGLRKPLYDGSPIEPDEEAIAIYQTSREITGDEKDYYFRYPFSEAIYEESLTYPDEEPLLLEEGEYIIGEDLPVGRASLLSNESVFTRENTVIHVGNFTIRDERGEVYFENLFHSEYGQLGVQVDLIPGHTIEIIGEYPEITVFYAETFPEDPYILMNPPEVLMNLERLDIQNPVSQNGDRLELTAGIFEVGEHIDPGKYAIQNVTAPHNTELFLFRGGEETRVFELLLTPELETAEQEGPIIELQTGDKIIPHLVNQLTLVRVNEE